MDAETQVPGIGNESHEPQDGDVEMTDSDSGLDKLLRKAVTVSQVNLPMAVIDEEIDDIVCSYSNENEHPDNVLDQDFLRLIERTRQRREQLNQKMGKTPEAAPRKRRTPLSEDLTSNVGDNSSQQNTDDSPKRQCVRGTEQEMKQDTPAIPSVKSRLHNLASQHSQWADTADNGEEDSSPVPTPRKSLSSPPLERARPAAQENTQPGSQRKSRFAQLASAINTWEDDLSHPTIVKEEEKKPRWQPPKPANSATAPEVTSPKKTRAPLPPSASSTMSSKTSSERAAPPVSSITKDSTRSPVRTGSTVGFNSSPKPFQPYKERAGRVSPVKSPAASRTNLTKEAQPKQESKVGQLASQVTMRNPATPSTASKPPSERPVSARLANWEQKISETSKPDFPATPKSGLAASSAVSQTPKQACTPARPLHTPARPLNTPAQPVKAINPAQEQDDVVQMRPKVRKSVDDEPTAHPVLARMSAWEQMTTANVVSDIKKVRPGDCTPIKTPGPVTPAAKRSPVKGPVFATPGRTNAVTPKKSFKDSINERAAQINPNSAAKPDNKTSPSKSLSPRNASSAMKQAQQKLVQQTQSTTMAERLRQERMAELQTIQNRWKNGILKDETDTESEEPPKSAVSEKKQTGREKARADDEEDMEIEMTENEMVGKLQVDSTEGITRKIPSDENQSNDTQDTDNGQADLKEDEKADLKEDEKAASGSIRNTAESMTLENTAASDENGTKHGVNVEPAEQKSDVGDDNTLQHLDSRCGFGDTIDKETNTADKITEMANKEAKVEEAQAANQEGKTADVETKATIDKTSGNEVVGQTKVNIIEHQQELTTTNFDNKLSAIGFEKSDKSRSGTAPPAPPPAPTNSASTGKPPRPTTLFNIVSQQKKGGVASPAPAASTANKACRKVKFDDSFESDDSDASLPKKQALQQHRAASTPVDDVRESDTTEDGPTEVTEDDSDCEVVLRRPRPGANQQRKKRSDEDDDLSLSAFVPASVRRQSILPSPQHQKSGAGEGQDTSFGSLDSFEGAPGAPPDFHKSTADLVALGRRHAEMDSSSSLTSQSTADSSSDLQHVPRRSGYCPEDTEDSVDDRDAIGDLLEEAMDSEEEGASTSARAPVPVMRKRPSHRKATEDGSMPFSINEYRASRNMQVLEVKQTIVRNSQYAGMHVREEEVEMPTRPLAPAPRLSLQERIKELQELIQQEQSVIMQTSNALNQCCTSSSYFAGSTEQVECNRILLLSCQRRQVYMMEIQRLRDTKVLDESGAGPKGSLTISDIRLPLKKEFVTKIGTSQDTTTCYFILLLKNGPQVIFTQMLSTHDPMMRGSLDFPNLIKINGITGNFRLQLEIYSMSVSREHIGKDKKKKTPKKMKGSALTVQSPGGPMAVRTTSFSQVTSLQLTMKSLDKRSFNLERLSHLSPLHGTIYMNLKCLMEASVEERGFLTMFEDVSGFGSWHRRWCALSGNKLQFWKYPDDESRKDPIGYIDLKRCITEKVGLISRDVCARPNTFELAVVRQPRKGEKDTLISRTYNTMTTIRHMLSADTKEERIVWCNKLNRALANIRTWHSDAMRPVS
ncbi:anillin-like protein 1 isoform X2 [Littorina saxatilis]|uniref:anillin-like protein 1 isoform X2 n=1 Tax=Littorina saxatilis TaxID=31220 RepID=UPI0038B5D5A2